MEASDNGEVSRPINFARSQNASIIARVKLHFFACFFFAALAQVAYNGIRVVFYAEDVIRMLTRCHFHFLSGTCGCVNFALNFELPFVPPQVNHGTAFL